MKRFGPGRRVSKLFSTHLALSCCVCDALSAMLALQHHKECEMMIKLASCVAHDLSRPQVSKLFATHLALSCGVRDALSAMLACSTRACVR